MSRLVGVVSVVAPGLTNACAIPVVESQPERKY